MDRSTFTIILASQSPRRVRLLKEAGYKVVVMPSMADEISGRSEDIIEIVEENARIKGNEVIKRIRGSKDMPEGDTILVAADTLVVMGQRVYGKPVDLDEAHQFIGELGGQEHQVLTGVFLYHFGRDIAVSFHDTTRVILRVMDREERDAVFQRVNPLDKAGAYGYQDSKDIVDRMTGSETTVIGLPMERLAEQLEALLAR